MKAGVREIAMVTGNPLKKGIFKTIGQETGLIQIIGHFETIEQAQKWLDE